MYSRIQIINHLVSETNHTIRTNGSRALLSFNFARIATWVPLTALLQCSGMNLTVMAATGVYMQLITVPRLSLSLALAPHLSKRFPSLRHIKTQHLLEYTPGQSPLSSKMEQAVCKHGAGAIVSKYAVDFACISSIWLGLKYGIDLQSLVGHSTANPWLGAMTTASLFNNSVLVPVHCVLGYKYADTISKWTDEYEEEEDHF